MGIKQIGRSLGLTKERRIELSDVLYEPGEVASKHHRTFDFEGALGYFALGAYGEDEIFKINFKGQRTSFSFDDRQLFRAFKVGDKVKIAYREEYKATYDYVPPEFDKKQLIGRVLSGYRFISIKKRE